MIRVIAAGLLAGIAMIALSMGWEHLSMIAANRIETEYANSYLFRQWPDKHMVLFFVQPFAVGIILAWIWSKTRQLFLLKNVWMKGCTFGVIYWVAALPGILNTYAGFPISMIIAASWTVSTLIQALAAGLIITRVVR